jgi:hypothetical protein
MFRPVKKKSNNNHPENPTNTLRLTQNIVVLKERLGTLTGTVKELKRIHKDELDDLNKKHSITLEKLKNELESKEKEHETKIKMILDETKEINKIRECIKKIVNSPEIILSNTNRTKSLRRRSSLRGTSNPINYLFGKRKPSKKGILTLKTRLNTIPEETSGNMNELPNKPSVVSSIGSPKKAVESSATSQKPKPNVVSSIGSPKKAVESSATSQKLKPRGRLVQKKHGQAQQNHGQAQQNPIHSNLSLD